ncbi:MAG TPA: BON domain-containing protein [Terriglobales bacterium]|nr:BON domain-containing protein [Terriglobales bacterium]
MDNRQRFDYDRDRRDDRDDWRERERHASGRDFMTNQPRYEQYGEMSNINDRDRDQYNRDWNRAQDQWRQGSQNYDYGQRDRGNQYGQSQQNWNQYGSNRQNQGSWGGYRDWENRDRYQSQNWDRQNRNYGSQDWSGEASYSEPYRSYQDRDSSSRNQSNFGRNYSSPSHSSNRYQESSDYGSGYDRRDYGDYGGEFSTEYPNRFGSTSFDRGTRADYRNRYENRYDRDRGHDESLTEKVGRFFGFGPKGYRRSDERIREDVSERLEDNPEVDATNIEVQVKDGEVTLTGSVDNRRAKRLAEDEAERCRGVKDVHNQIRVIGEIGGISGSETTTRKSATGTGTDKTRAA